MRYVIEDAKFAPGHVVVADGSTRTMMVKKIVVGFAECIWFQNKYAPPPGPTSPKGYIGGGLLQRNAPMTDIFHTSALTLAPNQGLHNEELS